jgi:hypothetical protein
VTYICPQAKNYPISEGAGGLVELIASHKDATVEANAKSGVAKTLREIHRHSQAPDGRTMEEN